MLTDEEFQTLVNVVDYNNNGTIEYIEFAETMKVNDVQVNPLDVSSGANFLASTRRVLRGMCPGQVPLERPRQAARHTGRAR